MPDHAPKNGQESRKEIIVKLRHHWHEFLNSKHIYLAKSSTQKSKIADYCPVATGNPILVKEKPLTFKIYDCARAYESSVEVDNILTKLKNYSLDETEFQ